MFRPASPARAGFKKKGSPGKYYSNRQRKFSHWLAQLGAGRLHEHHEHIERGQSDGATAKACGHERGEHHAVCHFRRGRRGHRRNHFPCASAQVTKGAPGRFERKQFLTIQKWKHFWKQRRQRRYVDRTRGARARGSGGNPDVETKIKWLHLAQVHRPPLVSTPRAGRSPKAPAWCCSPFSPLCCWFTFGGKNNERNRSTCDWFRRSING